MRSAEVGCFELAVARFRAELKTDTARAGKIRLLLPQELLKHGGLL